MPPGPSSAFSQVVFRAHVKTGLFMRRASITTNIAHLTLEKLKACPFPLPPAAEQERIVSEVSRLMSMADEIEVELERSLTRCHRLRQSILEWAFEGKLADQDPADEPASLLLERIRAERARTPARPTRGRRAKAARGPTLPGAGG
jgi:type I restriction enzyme S subunit